MREAATLRSLAGRALSRLVDPTVVLSFSRPGYRLHALAFRGDDLAVDLAGRRCLVSGANSGIGFETARGLALRGAEVVLLCRDRARGEAAAARIAAETGAGARARLEVLDVASLAAVRALGARLARGSVDVLVHNAGVLPAERTVTAEGLELTWATHVVGPHLFTKLLRPALERSPDGRVIWVSSGGMYARRLRLDDLAWRRRRYDGVVAYAETKRAQVVLAELWAERLRRSGVVVNAMHPGWVDTPAVRSSLPNFHRVTAPLLRTPAEGADTILWLAASPRAREHTGRFYFDRSPRRTVWLPGTRESAAERRALWKRVEADARRRRGEG